MTTQGIVALERLSTYVLSLPDRMEDKDWTTPSACAGWTVHDVVLHLVATLQEVVDPSKLPAGVNGDIEATNDRYVEHFRDSTPGQTLGAYRELLPAALAELRATETPDARDVLVDFDNAGKYPAHLIADSLAFDHYCHLRHDLAEPAGPLENLIVPATKEFLEPTVSWLMAGLPQMSPPSLAEVLVAPVRLFLSGSGGSSWVLSRATDGTVLVKLSEDEKVAATIITDADAFVRWGTRRVNAADAECLIAIRGERGLGRRVQQNIHVF